MTGKTKWPTDTWKEPKFKDALPPADRKPPKLYSSLMLCKWEIGRRWLIVRIGGGLEFKASAYFRSLGYRVFLPWITKARKNGGGKHMGIDLPWIRGYLFVWAENVTGADGKTRDIYYDLKNPIYSHGLLGPKGEHDAPYMIADTDEAMRRILNRADETGYIKEAEAPLVAYVEGDPVVIDAGIWGEVLGEVLKIGKHKTEVRAAIGGKAVSIHKLPHEQVKRKVVA